MINNVKKAQHSLKIIRRFDEDIWGTLALANKPLRILSYLFDIYQNNYKYKKLLRKRNFFLSKKRNKFLYKVVSDEKEFLRKKRTLKINNYLNMLKLRRFYGTLGKKQFKRIFRQPFLNSNTLARSFAFFLESRLDVILYRANFFPSIYAARQYINHKKVFVNGFTVNKPAFRVYVNDIITVENSSDLYLKMKHKLENKQILVNYPAYLEVNYKLAAIMLTKLPSNSEVPFPFFMNLNTITHNFL